MKYGVGDCGMFQREYPTKGEALAEIARRKESEERLHVDHPDWSWSCPHLMVDDGDGWRIAKRYEYD